MRARAVAEEFYETLPNGTRPPVVSGLTDGETAFAGAARQSPGALSGRIVFTCAGHGWTWGGSTWTTQRGVGREMNEDYGNLDQMNFFIPYAFNAGATVVGLRPIGHQANEVVLDNTAGFLARGGNLFFSGSHVADVLCGSAADPDLRTLFHAVPAEAPGDSARFLSFVPAKGSIFERNQPGWLGDATDQSYFVNATSRLLPDGAGARVALVCLDAAGGSAAVQYDGSAGGGKVVCFGFPFESMSSAKARARYVAGVLKFFGHPRKAGG